MFFERENLKRILSVTSALEFTFPIFCVFRPFGFLIFVLFEREKEREDLIPRSRV